MDVQKSTLAGHVPATAGFMRFYGRLRETDSLLGSRTRVNHIIYINQAIDGTYRVCFMPHTNKKTTLHKWCTKWVLLEEIDVWCSVTNTWEGPCTFMRNSYHTGISHIVSQTSCLWKWIVYFSRETLVEKLPGSFVYAGRWRMYTQPFW